MEEALNNLATYRHSKCLNNVTYGQSLKNPYTGILSIFSTQIRNGNNINIFEDGEESRDFVFIEEMLTQGVRGEVSELINEPHPECNEVKWLESVIVSSGNYIWFSEPSLSDSIPCFQFYDYTILKLWLFTVPL